jgi:hypothetical protein
MYSNKETTLHDRLATLFKAMDKGSERTDLQRRPVQHIARRDR